MLNILFSFHRSSILPVKKTNFPSEKRANEPIPLCLALSRWLPPSQTNLLFQTKEKQKERSCLQSLSRSRAVHLIFHPSRGNESLSPSLWIFFHANGRRENRRIISREREREESVKRAFSLFQEVASRALIRRAGFTLILGNLPPLSSIPLHSPSPFVDPCCNRVGRVVTELATSLKAHDSVALSRHFNEVEATDGSGALRSAIVGRKRGGETRPLIFLSVLFNLYLRG